MGMGMYSVGMVMGGHGIGNDLMGVGREWEQESHSRITLVYHTCNFHFCTPRAV